MTLRETAEALGVHYMTAYRYVRQGRLPATRSGTEWIVQRADVDALRKGSGQRRTGARRLAADRKALEDRMTAGDSAGAWWLVENHLSGGTDAPGVLTELLVPALRSIGDHWATGEASVSDEHQATSVALRIIGRLGLQLGRRGKTRGTVVLAAPSGELHTLPVSIVADLLRWRGFDVIELGGNTPADALAEAVRDANRLVAVGIAATTSGSDAEVAACVAAVRAAAPDAVIFLGGGAVPSADAAHRLGGDFWTGQGANAAVDTVESISAAAVSREPVHSA